MLLRVFLISSILMQGYLRIVWNVWQPNNTSIYGRQPSASKLKFFNIFAYKYFFICTGGSSGSGRARSDPTHQHNRPVNAPTQSHSASHHTGGQGGQYTTASGGSAGSTGKITNILGVGSHHTGGQGGQYTTASGGSAGSTGKNRSIDIAWYCIFRSWLCIRLVGYKIPFCDWIRNVMHYKPISKDYQKYIPGINHNLYLLHLPFLDC